MTALKIAAYVFLLHIAISSALTQHTFKIPNEEREKENDYWYSLMMQDIDFAVDRRMIKKEAKNIIIFLGDGMGVTVTTAGRIFKGQEKGHSGEEEFLIWEKFPNVALSKTYNLDKQVPDSAATGTALFCGVKGNYYTLGVNGKVMDRDCPASLREDGRADSILKWSQEAGKDTGIVTNTRITHATPAALFAHSAYRYWECDRDLKTSENDTTGCKDIARQLVEDLPGKDINVLFGGGRRQMGCAMPGDDGSSCLRNDSRNLVEEWLTEKHEEENSAEYVTNTQELRQLDPENVDYIMGLFGGNHLPYSFERDDGPEGTPTLKELTEVAIRRLQRNSKGFFLMVEGGRIDHALHDTHPHSALDELLAFEEAVEVALEMTNNDDTLIIVTADHSHVMTMNGYPKRGNDILGTTEYEFITDGLPFTTLMFTNGNATNFTWTGNKIIRSNLIKVDTTDHYFMSQAVVPTQMGYETHGGEDVAVYATGPHAHLFHRVHEQTYITHVMAYAACLGPYRYYCGRKARGEPRLSYITLPNEACRLQGVLGTVVLWILISSLF